MKALAGTIWSSAKGRRTRKFVLLALAVGLGYLAVKQSLATAIVVETPEVAYSLAPENGLIAGHFARVLATRSGYNGDRNRAHQLARRALLRDPTSVDAAVTLGLIAEVRGNETGAKTLFDYAQMLSRRDLQTELWAISDAIARNDIPATLLHYDIALRTSQTAPSLLFPVLANAIADSAIRLELAKRLRDQPAWTQKFISYLSTSEADPEAAAALLTRLPQYGVNVRAEDATRLIKNLIAGAKIDQAWSYYASFRSDAHRGESRDPDFLYQNQFPTPFDWVALNDSSISAAIQPSGEGGGALTFSAPPSVGGTAARQVELFPPGTYILEGRSKDIDQPHEALPYWSLSCRDGQELGRSDIPSSILNKGHFGGRFAVPNNCPVQILALVIRPSSKLAGIEGQINFVKMRPAS